MSAPAAKAQSGESQYSNIWVDGVAENIASWLPENDVACNVRLVNKATYAQFRDSKHVKLSLPCPEHAFKVHWGVNGALRGLTFFQRRKLLLLTAASGSNANLLVAFRAIAATLKDAALEVDDIPDGRLCSWLRDNGCWWLEEVFAAAAAAGRQAMCEWLLANDCPCGVEVVYSAVRGGHLGLMEWLLQQLPDLRGQMQAGKLLAAAAEGCALGDLQQLYGEWTQGPQQQLSSVAKGDILAAAAGSPTPDWLAKVEWLEVQGHPCGSTKPGCRAAAATTGPDAVSRLTLLSERGYPLEADAALSAARAGNVAALTYLLDRAGPQLDGEEDEGGEAAAEDMWQLEEAAAAGGHLEVLQALEARGHNIRRGMLVQAVSGGHQAVAAWLVELLQPQQHELQRCLQAAVGSGSPALVWWLVEEQGCPVAGEYGLVTAAAKSGCGELVERLAVEEGCEVEEEGGPYLQAVRNRDVATLRLLRRLDVPMHDGDAVYLQAGSQARGDLAAVRLLRDQLAYPWSPSEDTFAEWVRAGYSLPCLRWLAEEAGCPVDWQAAVRAAEAGRGAADEDVKKWLREEQKRRSGPTSAKRARGAAASSRGRRAAAPPSSSSGGISLFD